MFDGGEVEEFLTHIRETFPDAEYSVEPKVDGLSVAPPEATAASGRT